VPDERRVIAAIPAFLEWLCREAPPGLAENARDLSRLDAAEWHRHVRAAFADPPGGQGTGSETAMFVVEALIQPLTEEPDDGRLLPDTPAAPGKDQRRCPACGCLPVLGVLHEEGHGAGRMLVCARCGGAWPYPRVSCPGCGAREFDALPVYTAEQFPHVRLDACDRCRRYLKTVDLTKDGLAVPQVDDLASLSLDLWARQQGYVRLRVNLLRT
jgi:formate dehydrogenase accessory protein FdhE